MVERKGSETQKPVAIERSSYETIIILMEEVKRVQSENETLIARVGFLTHELAILDKSAGAATNKSSTMQITENSGLLVWQDNVVRIGAPLNLLDDL